MNDYHNGDNLDMEPHVQDDYTITVTRTEPSSGLGTIEYSVQAPETTKAFSDPAVRAAWTLGPVSDTQPKRRLQTIVRFRGVWDGQQN